MCETRNTNIWAVLVGYYCLLCVLCLEPKGVSVSVCVRRNRFLIIEACGGDYVQCSNDLVVVGDRREQMQILLIIAAFPVPVKIIQPAVKTPKKEQEN